MVTMPSDVTFPNFSSCGSHGHSLPRPEAISQKNTTLVCVSTSKHTEHLFMLLFIYATMNIVNYLWWNWTEGRTEQRHKQPTCFVKKTTFSTAVTLYTGGVFLTALNLAAFMGTPSPVVLQSAGLHQQSGFGTGDMCEPSWAMRLKDCFHLGKLGLYITVVELS